MHDLIGAYNRISRTLRMYVESAFPLRYDFLTHERRALLGSQGTLTQPPLIEPLPVYPSSARTLEQAGRELGNGFEDLHHVSGALLPGKRELWKH